MAIEKFADSFTPELIALMPKYVAGLRSIMREMGNRPMTLIHGDVRMDNAMFGNGKPGLLPVVMIDWQNVMVSTPMQDMAWMLGTSVTTKVRRMLRVLLTIPLNKHVTTMTCRYCLFLTTP
jgi:aminoglycoside phosphotransferase (APT) family kinase protein